MKSGLECLGAEASSSGPRRRIPSRGCEKKKDDDIVDADFEVVDDEKEKVIFLEFRRSLFTPFPNLKI